MFDNLDKINFLMSENNTISDLNSLLDGYTNLGNTTQEVQDLKSKFADRQKELENTLSESQRKLYNAVVDDDSEITYLLTHEAFILGYKMATRLLLEGMK